MFVDINCAWHLYGNPSYPIWISSSMHACMLSMCLFTRIFIYCFFTNTSMRLSPIHLPSAPRQASPSAKYAQNTKTAPNSFPCMSRKPDKHVCHPLPYVQSLPLPILWTWGVQEQHNPTSNAMQGKPTKNKYDLGGSRPRR